MTAVSIDTETCLIAPGLKAPPIVCLTWASDYGPPGILHWSEAYPFLRSILYNQDMDIVGHNIAFDLAVICSQWPDLTPLVYAAYDADRVTDTMARAQLLDLYAGTFSGYADPNGKWVKPLYNLAAVAKRYSSKTLNKDGWRMFYGEFRDVPLEGWVAKAKEIQAWAANALPLAEYRLLGSPKNSDLKKKVRDLKALVESEPEEVLRYPVEDAVTTLEVYETQEHHASLVPYQFEQARSEFFHTLMSAWGMKTNPAGVKVLEENTKILYQETQRRLVVSGLVRPDGSKDTKAAIARMKEVGYAEGLELKLTESGNISLDADACKASGDAVLQDYARYSMLKAVMSKDVPMLLAGNVYPVQTHFGLAATGRDTSSGPNMQNLRKLKGYREVFVPRPGWCFLQADYPALELHTLAQSCLDLFGHSELGRQLNAGVDPHSSFAGALMSVSYEEVLSRLKAEGKSGPTGKMRHLAKAFNFGKPGGMGNKKFVDYLKAQGIILDESEVRTYDYLWKRTFPEMLDLFEYAARECDGGFGTAVTPRSKRARGGANYTAFCNTLFQGPGSDCTKRAGWLLSRACYAEPSSPLFGSRPVMVVHDEYILETQLGPGLDPAARELGRLMAEGANYYVPDVPFEPIEVVAMLEWSKDATPVFDCDKLIPWVP